MKTEQEIKKEYELSFRESLNMGKYISKLKITRPNISEEELEELYYIQIKLSERYKALEWVLE